MPASDSKVVKLDGRMQLVPADWKPGAKPVEPPAPTEPEPAPETETEPSEEAPE